MFKKTTISMFTKDQYDKYATNIVYSSEIGDNKYTFNEQTRTVRVRKLAGSTASGFRIPAYSLFKDDIIKIQCEYRWISGTNASFLMLEHDILTPRNNGDWETVDYTCVLKNDYLNYTGKYIEIGAYAGATGGEYEMRNVTVEIISQHSKELTRCVGLNVIKRNGLNFALEPNNSYVPVNWGLIIDGDNIKITFPLLKKRPTAIVQTLGYLHGSSYNAKITELHPSYVTFGLWDITNNTRVTLANIPTTENIWLSLLVTWTDYE